MKNYLLLMTILIGFSQCTPQSSHAVFQLDQATTLSYGKSMKAANSDLIISFTNIEDSRCPEGVNCIVAGKATATLNIAKGQQTETKEVSVKGLCKKGCGSSTSAFGYTIKVHNVDPYPSNSSSIKTEDYVLKLTVRK